MKKNKMKKIKQCNCSRHSSFFFWMSSTFEHSSYIWEIVSTGESESSNVEAHEVAFPASLVGRAQMHDLDLIRCFHMTLWIGRRRRHHADILIRVVVDTSSLQEVAWQMLSTQHLAEAAGGSPLKKFEVLFGCCYYVEFKLLYLTFPEILWSI